MAGYSLRLCLPEIGLDIAWGGNEHIDLNQSYAALSREHSARTLTKAVVMFATSVAQHILRLWVAVSNDLPLVR